MNTSKEQTLDDKSWAGNYWGRNGALRQELAKHRALLHNRFMKWHGMNCISSAYHSAAGNAVAKMRAQWWFAPFWAIVALWCAERALRWSNKLWNESSAYEKTPDICEVRQSICRKVSAFLPWRRRYLGEASCAVDNGLLLLSGHAHTPHVRPLLLIGRADILLREGKMPEDVRPLVNEIREMADAVIIHLSDQSTLPFVIAEKRHYARVYRHLADLYLRVGWRGRAATCRLKMLDLAEESGAADQVLKSRVR